MRTPIGRYGGMFSSLTAVDLGVTALKGLLDRTGIAPDAVDDVILGHCYPNSEAPAIGRVVALDAGLPVTVPGMQVDRRCGSGLQAVIQACMQVSTGNNDLVVAGGAESMSNVAFYSTDMRWGGGRSGVKVHDGLARGRTTAGGQHYPVPGGMLETAENLRRQYGISRQEQDELAVASHQRAVAAQKDGILAEEIIPVTVRTRQGEQLIDTDEHPRADTSVESLARLKPVLGKDDPDATVTAGNASGQNDAASMCIVTTPEKAAELGLDPLVRLVSWGSAGVAPNIMGIGPVPVDRGRARQGRSAAERHRRDRTQRGVRGAGACRDAGMGIHRRRPRADERARVGDFARPPRRRHRRADARHAGARTESARGALRAGNHVYRRRAGPGGGVRKGRSMSRIAQTLGLTEFQTEIVANVRQFVDKEIIPNAQELEHADTYPQDIVDQMREMGLFGLMIPEEYGGLGESLLTYALCVEELARGWMSVSGVINTHFIVAYMLRQHGTEEQKQRFLPRMATGETRGAFSMSEPELGSDVAAIRTRAKHNDDGTYTIDGQKMWLTNGGSSTLVAVLVRTDEGAEKPHRNLTAFLVEKPTGFGEVAPGLVIPGKIDKLGYKGIDTTELIFDGYVAKADDILGEAPGPGVLPDDGRHRGRQGQRVGTGMRRRHPRIRAGHSLRATAPDLRQADRRAPGHRVPTGRDGDESRSGAPDDGQRRQAQGLR